MIIDKIENAHLYYSISPNLKKGLVAIENINTDLLEIKRYDIDGDNVYAMVQEYEPKDIKDGKFEAHRKYTDIQFMVTGTEQMGWANINNLSPTQDFDMEKDFIFGTASNISMINVPQGYFVIFTPEDAHMPCISSGEKGMVKKIVVKVVL